MMKIDLVERFKAKKGAQPKACSICHKEFVDGDLVVHFYTYLDGSPSHEKRQEHYAHNACFEAIESISEIMNEFLLEDI